MTTSITRRVLGRIRLSRATDETTSPERQREIIQQWANTHDAVIVGWAEDLDVSGSVDPFDTPSLGHWLNHRVHEWDTLVAWKLDRLGRNILQLNGLIGWAEKHDKTIVSCNENLDFATWQGQMLAGIMAGLAQGELEAIKERTGAARRKLVTSGRWFGGRPQYGYRAVQSGDGWTLEHDPETLPVLRQIIADTIGGVPAAAVVRELNTQGVLSPSDSYRKRQGKPLRGTPWNPTTLLQMLKSRSLLGEVTHNGATVRNDDGSPILAGPPLINLDTFQRLQQALDKRAIGRANPRVDTSPLLGVVVCAVCGKNLIYQQQYDKRNGNTRRYYYCRDRCGQNIRAAELESWLEETFLDELGSYEVTERVWVPASSNQQELRQAQETLDELLTLLPSIGSHTARERLTKQIAAIDKRITELENEPGSEGHYEYHGTGETYAEVWARGDQRQRRTLLLKSGISATARVYARTRGSGGAHEFNIRIPGDLLERMDAGSTEEHFKRREAEAAELRKGLGIDK
ncbi:recombinase family protein [Nocardia speluncae]|uniref:Recombinase family protein n=1 Tax=Nocardia speluncae TaxID=419477 RepID=A0A846XKY9_9NOCA|nr:recombinase family protein [Nocardia speluncae]NKY35243.1 recombinase family protein [Nocardia speluncae]